MIHSFLPTVEPRWNPFTTEEAIAFSDDIPGWMEHAERKWLCEQARQLKPVNDKPPIWVEIGTWCGKSMLPIVSVLPQSSVFVSIDIWQGGYVPEKHNWSKAPPLMFEDIYFTAVRIRPDIRIVTFRMDSVSACKWFEDRSVSAVFVDANHSYEACKEDIRSWGQKLHPTGLLSGHDYNTTSWPGVVQAVDEYDPERKLPAGSIWHVKTPQPETSQ